jgi:hypothetical protein
MEALNARFRDHTNKLFLKHGMTIIGFWQPVDVKEAEEKLIYILSYPDREAADKSWLAFRDDPDWNQARTASETDGVLVQKVESIWMSPWETGANFDASQQPAATKLDKRLFQLRIYTAEPGKMEALNGRFRNHGNALFKKYGMTIIGFWAPTDPKEAEERLIYILAYPSKEAAEKSWQSIRDDPEWKATLTASEKDGKLVKKIESIYLNPTNYSPIK